MSYIEKKYRENIDEIFNELNELESYLLELFNKKSLAIVDNVAGTCSKVNKKINLILKKFYPEIKQMDEKLEIKSILKFYFDLIDKLTDFIRNVENFQKLEENYYDAMIDFLNEKNDLILGKYRNICKNELTAFYDTKTRENLEKILAEKIALRERAYFTFGSLEQEIKKIAKVAGAENIKILTTDMPEHIEQLDSAKSIITITCDSEEEDILKNVSNELKHYLESKGYQVKLTQNILITNAKLLSDEP